MSAVLVCLCRRVSEREVRAAVAEGVSTVAELQRVCGAGTVLRSGASGFEA